MQVFLHAITQSVVGRIHVGEQRVTTNRRNLLHVQDASHRGHWFTRDITVPRLSICTTRVFICRDHQNLFEARAICCSGVNIEITEATAKCNVLLWCHLLVTEENDAVLV